MKDLHVGKDDQARRATVTLPREGKKSYQLQRPIQLLYPFEVSSDNSLKKIDIKLQDLKTEEQVDVQSHTEANCLKEISEKSRGEGSSRPQIKAAVEGEVKRRFTEHFTC